jgi:hypothetical protein
MADLRADFADLSQLFRAPCEAPALLVRRPLRALAGIHDAASAQAALGFSDGVMGIWMAKAIERKYKYNGSVISRLRRGLFTSPELERAWVTLVIQHAERALPGCKVKARPPARAGQAWEFAAFKVCARCPAEFQLRRMLKERLCIDCRR